MEIMWSVARYIWENCYFFPLEVVNIEINLITILITGTFLSKWQNNFPFLSLTFNLILLKEHRKVGKFLAFCNWQRVLNKYLKCSSIKFYLKFINLAFIFNNFSSNSSVQVVAVAFPASNLRVYRDIFWN